MLHLSMLMNSVISFYLHDNPAEIIAIGSDVEEDLRVNHRELLR